MLSMLSKTVVQNHLTVVHRSAEQVGYRMKYANTNHEEVYATVFH